MGRTKGISNRPKVEGTHSPIQTAADLERAYPELCIQLRMMWAEQQSNTITQPDTSEVVTIGDPPTFRKLWQIVQRSGATVRNMFDRQEVESAIRRVGYVDSDPKGLSDYWQFHSRFVGQGPASAVDVDGNFSAVVNQDGSAVITHHVAPNLHNRPHGMRYADVHVRISNLEDFVSRLWFLQTEADAIFDETVAQTLATQAELVAKGENQNASIHGGDVRIEQMWLICEEFGFTGPHAPSVTDLPFRLAGALGIPLSAEDGTKKGWAGLSDEVIARANMEAFTAGPRYQP